jgi:hypothetical protein
LVRLYGKLAWSLALSAVIIGAVDAFVGHTMLDATSQMVTRGSLYVFLVILTVVLPRFFHVIDLHELLRSLKVTIACLAYSTIIELSMHTAVSFFIHMLALTL